jgi:hypothetical protein
MISMLFISIFVSMASATTVLETGTDQISNTKTSNLYDIPVSDKSMSSVYEACIAPTYDKDWFTSSDVQDDDKVVQFLVSSAYNDGVAMYAEDDDENFVERLSDRYNDAGDGIVDNAPYYTKIVHDYNYLYGEYQFFLSRNQF